MSVVENDSELLRRRVAEITRARDAAIAEAAAEHERNAVLLIHCDQLASEIFAWRHRYTRAAEELTQARGTIEHMERSKFWRMRMAWVRVKGLVGTSRRQRNGDSALRVDVGS